MKSIEVPVMKLTTLLFAGYRFPRDIIAHAVWLYHRFSLSFRDVEDLLAERGITVTYETIRQWCLTFGPKFARTLRHRRGRPGDTWFLDEDSLLSGKNTGNFAYFRTHFQAYSPERPAVSGFPTIPLIYRHHHNREGSGN